MPRRAGSSSGVTANATIPVDIQRALRALETRVMELQSQVTSLQTQLGTKLGNTPTDLKAASRTIRDELQSNGSAPLSLTKLSGVAAQPQVAAVSSNVPVVQQQEGMLIQQNGQLYTVQGGQLIPALKSGDLTEATSGVLTITGGLGAVLGSGTGIQVKKATNAQDGYLSAADWTAFNAKQNSLAYTPLNPANNLSDLANAGIARTNLGLALVASSGTYADLTGKPTIPAVLTLGRNERTAISYSGKRRSYPESKHDGNSRERHGYGRDCERRNRRNNRSGGIDRSRGASGSV
jgi:hypothetical protein